MQRKSESEICSKVARFGSVRGLVRCMVFMHACRRMWMSCTNVLLTYNVVSYTNQPLPGNLHV